jgi:hypothetical protein
LYWENSPPPPPTTTLLSPFNIPILFLVKKFRMCFPKLLYLKYELWNFAKFTLEKLFYSMAKLKYGGECPRKERREFFLVSGLELDFFCFLTR